MNYILDKDNNVMTVSDEEYTGWWHNEQNFKIRRIVGKARIGTKLISTVLLPKWAFTETGTQLPFETKIYEESDMSYPIYEENYSKWHEAAKGHERAVEWVIKNDTFMGTFYDEKSKPKESKYDDIKNFIEECIEGVENGIVGATALADHCYSVELKGNLYAYKNVLSFIRESEND